MSKLNLKNYLYSMRLHKPIGIFLLLWPTLWALWLASDGKPGFFIASIFIAGTVLMRSAGCIINDIADRHIDKHVERTRDRPITAGKVSVREALVLFFLLVGVAFLLILTLNKLTILLSFVGILLAVVYPFLKRVTHLPQLGLGLAFAWAVPMAFAAETNSISIYGWELFLAAAIWPIIYDTMYALVDLPDDKKIGVKSMAILCEKNCAIIIGCLQIVFLAILTHLGLEMKLTFFYYIGLIIAGLLFIYQQWLIKDGVGEKCFKAFLNNHWVGLIIFIGIVLS